MLRRPSPSFTPTASGAAPVLPRRGSVRAGLAGVRRRDADVASSGVVPRMRRPRGTSAAVPAGDATDRGSGGADRLPHGRGTALEQRIERHLTRLQGTSRPRGAATIDDDRARRDPDTTSFAAVRPDAPAVDPSAASAASGARVATAADRPRTAELPAQSSHDGYSP